MGERPLEIPTVIFFLIIPIATAGSTTFLANSLHLTRSFKSSTIGFPSYLINLPIAPSSIVQPVAEKEWGEKGWLLYSGRRRVGSIGFLQYLDHLAQGSVSVHGLKNERHGILRTVASNTQAIQGLTNPGIIAAAAYLL